MGIFDDIFGSGNVQYNYPSGLDPKRLRAIAQAMSSQQGTPEVDPMEAMGGSTPMPSQLPSTQPSGSPSSLAQLAPTSAADDPNAPKSFNGLERFMLGALGQGKEVEETQKKSELYKIAQRYKAGDKSALIDLAVTDPSAASVIASIGSKNEALTNVAKLKADLDAGRIDKATYDRALAKDVAPTEKNYKQFQLQNASFADRMVNASGILSPFEEKLNKGEFNPVNKTSKFLAAIPSLGLGEAAGNAWLSEDQQKYKNAAQEWIRAKLRKESGAAIGVKEMEDEFKTYFPQVGDSPEVIKQKAQLREVATDSMIKQTSGAYDDMYGDGSTTKATPKPAATEDRIKALVAAANRKPK